MADTLATHPSIVQGGVRRAGPTYPGPEIAGSALGAPLPQPLRSSSAGTVVRLHMRRR